MNKNPSSVLIFTLNYAIINSSKTGGGQNVKDREDNLQGNAAYTAIGRYVQI